MVSNRLLLYLSSKLNWAGSAPVSLSPTGSSDIDRHGLGPHFTFSRNYFLRRSVVRISRKAELLEVDLHHSFLKPRAFQTLFPRLITVLQAYATGVSKILDHSQTSSGHAFFQLDLADGGSSYAQIPGPKENFYAFARKRQHPGVGLIPDPYSLSDLANGIEFECYENEAQACAAYQERRALIFWRGSTTGRTRRGRIRSNQRIRFCLDALEQPGSVDAKITNVVQFWNNRAAFKALVQADVMAHQIPEAEFSNYKATVDLDGNAASWGALRKYLRLMHVIKPLSPFEMFYHVSQPARTFTSVESLDDLFAKLRRNADLADNFEIAWQGYLFALDIRRKIAAGEATVFPR